MAEIRIKRAPTLRAEINVPGDKSITHRAILFSALSNGACVLRGYLTSEDCMCTVEAMRALGVKIETPEPTEEEPLPILVVHGRKREFDPPSSDIYCGNSGTLMRLLTGLLAGQPFDTRLTGDASLSGRPMGRVIDPLTAMGAKIEAEGVGGTAPLLIRQSQLGPIHYESPIASAQVKSAVLLAGMNAKGRTSVTEPAQSRDHTEKMLEYFLVQLSIDPESQTVSIVGGQTPESRDFFIPGDISSAAFWLVAAAAQKNSHLLVKDVGMNKTRTGILGVLIRMGAHIREVIQSGEDAEPCGVIEIKGEGLRGTVIGEHPSEIANVIDELPVLAVAGALAQGRTLIRNAGELRVKETDRIAAVAANLKAMGVNVTEYDDGMEIVGGGKLKGARLQCYGDHRIAMAFTIAGMFADGETVIEDTDCVNTSYPGFGKALESIIKQSSKRGTQTTVVDEAPPN